MTIVKSVGLVFMVWSILYYAGVFYLTWPVFSRPTGIIPQLKGEKPETEKSSVEAVTVAALHRQKLSDAKQTQKEMLALCRAAKKGLDESEKELDGWEAEGPPLLKNEAGKRIAGDPEQTRRVRGLLRSERMSRDQLVEHRDQVERFEKEITQSFENPSDSTDAIANFSLSLSMSRDNARIVRDHYREARDGVRGILARVKATPPASMSLEEAIAVLDQEEATERAAQIDASMKKAQDEGARIIAEEKAKLIRAAAEKEAALIANEAALRRQEIEQAKALTDEKMRRNQREAEAQRARLQDEAEQQRIGALSSGSKWRGEYTSQGFKNRVTLTIASRTKDDVRGGVTSGGSAGVDTEFDFEGRVVGNKLKLEVTRMLGPAGNTLELIYSPTTKTITGNTLNAAGRPIASINVRLVE